MSDIITAALDTVREHLRRGGMAGGFGVGLPYAGGGLPAANSFPVMPGLAHAYVKHAVRTRPHFAAGGPQAETWLGVRL